MAPHRWVSGVRVTVVCKWGDHIICHLDWDTSDGG